MDLLQQHEVLFLDFLGFASAVELWDDERMQSLIAVLAGIADAQSTFDIKGEPQSDGSYSDNIVVSYPLIYANRDDEVGRFLSTGWAGMVRHQMQRITARVVRAALDVDLLVRGGLSQGSIAAGS